MRTTRMRGRRRPLPVARGATRITRAAAGPGSFTIGKASSTTAVTCPASVTYNGTARTPCTALATGVGMSAVDVSASLVYANNANARGRRRPLPVAGRRRGSHTSSSGSGSFTIARASQRITFGTLPDRAVGTPPFTVIGDGDVGLGW